eukprot:TRINITY_DN6328_c0_g1_i1.p1 TRINITY_DN6328_c0_g1~~TRINITY_DN6328_c0_g1_i1.p1  ORF type:complete len:281 (-),score=1.13 TRINITY_DN6328_c0_g1_i1:767-1555(-)
MDRGIACIGLCNERALLLLGPLEPSPRTPFHLPPSPHGESPTAPKQAASSAAAASAAAATASGCARSSSLDGRWMHLAGEYGKGGQLSAVTDKGVLPEDTTKGLRSDLQGTPLSALLHPDCRNAVWPRVQAALQGMNRLLDNGRHSASTLPAASDPILAHLQHCKGHTASVTLTVVAYPCHGVLGQAPSPVTSARERGDFGPSLQSRSGVGGKALLGNVSSTACVSGAGGDNSTACVVDGAEGGGMLGIIVRSLEGTSPCMV